MSENIYRSNSSCWQEKHATKQTAFSPAYWTTISDPLSRWDGDVNDRMHGNMFAEHEYWYRFGMGFLFCFKKFILLLLLCCCGIRWLSHMHVQSTARIFHTRVKSKNIFATDSANKLKMRIFSIVEIQHDDVQCVCVRVVYLRTLFNERHRKSRLNFQM